MNKVIVTTTIQNPTKAIEKFDSLKDWTLIVAGDLKTPKDYKLKKGIYISPKEQEQYNKGLSEAIGWNNHGRRNFGNLLARDMGADVIAVVDDDNTPLDDWGKDLLVGKDVEVNKYETDLTAFDPIGATNYPHLWHRGFPLQLVAERDYTQLKRENVKCDIQADFWNGDPDIDAVCRMIYAPECTFNEDVFPFSSNKPSPFNSQNIFISKEVLPHYFVLPHISPGGRMGDIWIAYHIQAMGFKVLYQKPSVYQDRNEHDLTLDMIDEYCGYEKCIKIVRSIANDTYQADHFWPSLRHSDFLDKFSNGSGSLRDNKIWFVMKKSSRAIGQAKPHTREAHLNHLEVRYPSL